MNYDTKYYELSQFIGCYFHQDWNHCYDWQGKEPDWKIPVLKFKENTLPENLSKVIKQMENLLAENLNNNQLEEALEEIGSFVYVPALGYKTYRTWAEDILKLLKEP